MVLLLALLLAASPPAPLAAALAHLKSDHPESLLLDLADDVQLAPDQGSQAASLLVQASEKIAKQDRVLSRQLAQMAYRRDSNSVAAVARLTVISRIDRQYGEAEKWCDAWLRLAPDDARARLERARIAACQGDWETVQTVGNVLLNQERLSKSDKAELKSLLERATADDRTESTSAAIAERLRAAAKAIEERLHSAGPAAVQERHATFDVQTTTDSSVILYGTSWCRYCRAARAYFHDKHVPFEDKDIEADPEAARELMEKARAANIHPGGVPVIDVQGTLVQGFDRPRLDQLLAQ